MKTQPIIPARIDFSDSAAPLSIDFADIYHSRSGALAQARHVFLGGNGLPQRWRGRERFVILETGFGLGHNFLATWDAWRADASRCERLTFISIDKHPPSRADLRTAHALSPLPGLANQLAAAWPALTHNLHSLDFEGGKLRLLLAFGDVAAWLPEIVANVDAFYLDGFAPSRNADMWDRRVFKGIARLAAPGATAATWSVARTVLDGFAQTGFIVDRVPGFGDKPEMSAARYAPAFTPRRAPARLPQAAHRDAIVVGAGLAGAWAARSLTDEGVRCIVIDQHPQPAMETSGNPAGLFHGIVTPEDGAHARFNRAAALHAQRVLAPWLAAPSPTAGAAGARLLASTTSAAGPFPIRSGDGAPRDGLPMRCVAGRLAGLLRLQSGDVAAMQSTLGRLGLPPDYAQALDAGQASAIAGQAVASAAWFYPGGGWLSPVGLIRKLLDGIDLRTTTRVASIRRVDGRWQALGAGGVVIATGSALVLANAGDALRLLGQPAWPLQQVRGQVSLLRTSSTLPRLPIAGSGYVIDLGGGEILCGATNQPGDDDPCVRESDHAHNLAQLSSLLGHAIDIDGPVTGRVGWRLSSTDRLPVLGQIQSVGLGDRIDTEAALKGHPRHEQARFVPRTDGLYILTALGSRGITWAPLAARIVAAWVTGSPLPLEASLLDAVDVARFASRAARRGTA